MRKARKKQAEDFIKLLGQAHEEIKRLLERGDVFAAMDLLGQCQEGAVKLGGLIESEEGEGVPTIPLLEEYCELTYGIYQELAQGREINADKINKKLCKSLIRIEESVRNDIKVRFEIVFLPYKASMWDSLESVWQAADEDPDCDAYVVPIPYYDRTSDGQLGEFHYEGDQFPSYVPITHYQEYSLPGRRPDAVYIHNPYDFANYATSVEPEFYSFMLKKYTECLVYIPYYSTTGGMSEDQVSCPGYYYADYIVIQAEKYRKFFDSALPEEKMVPLGSPKFDRILRTCANPSEPPERWKEKLEGKTVYFYNTSLGGMLADTDCFLKKMEYVFRCFAGREDACLLWRPHPLMESTFQSARKEYKPRYDALKDRFIREKIGIYDDTPDIANTIALCNAYVGDAGTSVTSLFGMAGKPQFILDNHIAGAPEAGDWRGEIIRGFPIVSGVRDGVFCAERDSWMVTQGNRLYRSLNHDGLFRYFCDLSDYAAGNYYSGPAIIDGKVYIYPINAQNILMIGQKGIEKRIRLQTPVEQMGAFYSALVVGSYLFLIPRLYPFVVRYDTKTDEVCYFDVDKEVFTGLADEGWRCGAVGVKKGKVYMASPLNNRVLVIEAETGEQKVVSIKAENPGGYMAMASMPDDEDFWLLPYSGGVIARWNPETEEVREYPISLENFRCHHIIDGHECMERPLGSAVFYKNYVYFSPCWGNMYICLDKDTGSMAEWKPPVEEAETEKNGYFIPWARGYLNAVIEGRKVREYRLFSVCSRKLYRVDFEENRCQEITVDFDTAELQTHEPGFWEQSQWFQYGCQENAFNSLPDFLDGKISGGQFDRERQLAAYRQLSANSDGTSGEKIHQFVRGKLW